ncbi:hypothetical protein JNJ66_06810 [Candidatus Saccharibacteria bacterium]|nr:hypothetical protein [Candidatus Saccharibacteria bacterium]
MNEVSIFLTGFAIFVVLLTIGHFIFKSKRLEWLLVSLGYLLFAAYIFFFDERHPAWIMWAVFSIISFALASRQPWRSSVAKKRHS